ITSRGYGLQRRAATATSTPIFASSAAACSRVIERSGDPPIASKRCLTSSTISFGVGLPRRMLPRNAATSSSVSTGPWQVTRTAVFTRRSLLRIPGDHDPVVLDLAVSFVGEVLHHHLVSGDVGADFGERDRLV